MANGFICKVLTPQGQVVKIKMTENDKIECLKKLKRNGMTPISIKHSLSKFKSLEKGTAKIYSKRKNVKKNNIIIQLSNRVSTQEIKVFTQDFYMLKKSNFTSEHALKTIISNTKNLELKRVLNIMLKSIQKGIPLYKTMEEYKNIFPLEYTYLIKMGELTGKLEVSLEYVIKYLDNEEKLKSRINKILIPNIIMFLCIIILTFSAILIGIPLLKNIFMINGSINIPKGILVISNILSKVFKYWYIIVLLIASIIVIFIKFINSDEGKYRFDKFICTNILFGKIIYFLNFSRILSSLEINLKNKMRLQDALDISKNVIKNTYILNTLEKSANNIYIGKSWIEPLEENLSPIIIELLKKGSKNNLIEVIEKVIEYINIEIENEMNRLLKILPEISYGIVGISILIFVITVLLPCIQIYLSGFLFS